MEWRSIMSLKQLSSSVTINRREENSNELNKPIESGALTLSPSQQERALEKCETKTITVLSRTTMVEDGVSSLVPLGYELTKDYELKYYTIRKDQPADNLHAAMRMVQSLLPLPQSEIEQRLTAMSIC